MSKSSLKLISDHETFSTDAFGQIESETSHLNLPAYLALIFVIQFIKTSPNAAIKKSE